MQFIIDNLSAMATTRLTITSTAVKQSLKNNQLSRFNNNLFPPFIRETGEAAGEIGGKRQRGGFAGRPGDLLSVDLPVDGLARGSSRRSESCGRNSPRLPLNGDRA